MYKLYLFDEYIGNLFYEYHNNRESFAFEFSSDYLENHFKIILDPELALFEGRQFSNDIFGFINDLIPDRFGKALLNERERELAEKEKRLPRKLTTLDYILGTNDLTRMGAIRIQDENGVFVSDSKENAVPPYIYLRDIEEASLKFEDSGVFSKDEYRRLLLPGSSLGGARPKANIYYNDELYIAKFPSKNDTYDVEAWEKISLDLASLCGIDVSESKLENYSKLGSTLLVKRFDRNKEKRIHYMSFMTMLSAKDGESDKYSYLDLASFLKAACQDVTNCLHELYRRLIFTYLINNTDNHLRNHGLLYDGETLKLSPMFDVNPSFESSSFVLSLTYSGLLTKEAIINESKYYNLTKEDALALYSNMVKVIKENVSYLANKYNAKKRELDTLLMILDIRM